LSVGAGELVACYQSSVDQVHGRNNDREVGIGHGCAEARFYALFCSTTMPLHCGVFSYYIVTTLCWMKFKLSAAKIAWSSLAKSTCSLARLFSFPSLPHGPRGTLPKHASSSSCIGVPAYIACTRDCIKVSTASQRVSVKVTVSW